MAVVTYPAANLGAPRRAPSSKRNAPPGSNAGVAALVGMGVMALAGAASIRYRKPSIAIGGLLAGALAAALAFEAEHATR